MELCFHIGRSTMQHGIGLGSRLALGLLTATLATAHAATAQPAGGPIVLAPHRAVYEIKLDQSRGGAGVADMTGRMVYELSGSQCDGYTQNMRFVTRMTNQEGGTTISDMRSSSWEDGLFKAFRFTSSQYKDTKLTESTQGDAARGEPAGDVKVDLVKPEKKEVKLKRDVYFPMQHSIALLVAARKGDTILQADLYDGSEKGEKFYATTAYIGRIQAKGFNKTLPAVPSAAKLDDLASWPVSISYFDPLKEKQDGLPSYELAFLYFENGVSRRLFIDYGDFAIRGTLKEIAFLDPVKCETKK